MTANITNPALKEAPLDEDVRAVGNNGTTLHTAPAPVTAQAEVSPGYRLTPEGERIGRQIASFNPEPILILGPAGTGKSLLIRHIAQQLGIDFVAVNAHQGLDISQLVGLWRPVQTESGITIEWEDGSLTRSVKTGGLFLFEEITRAPQELLSRLFGLLDTDGRYWPLPEAGIDGVEVHPNFWFVATGNPVGSGYHTASLDRALEDRFQAIYEIKEPLAPERDVLADLVGGDVADGLDRFATDARRNESTYVSTRNLIQAARLVQRGTHPVEAVTLAISRKFRGYQDGLDELARLHLARTSRNLQLSEDSEVVFPDKHLETAVRKELKRPSGPITRDDLKSLGKLRARGMGISKMHKAKFENLSGLEHAVNLTRLDLGKNRISDITPLTSLTNLTKLDLGDNQIIDIAPLASLTQLNWVDLSNNRISNISPLASLIRLRLLFLGLNPLSQESIDVHAPNLSSRRVNVEL
ncbi:MAG TPA: AAA family ATPase [Dehalococcoidia bacterium]|nr:AAA family ATPase [Dehalococcoidia bacterium]